MCRRLGGVCGCVCVCRFRIVSNDVLLCGKRSEAECVVGAAHLPMDCASALKVTRMRTKISCGPEEEKFA